RAGHASVTHPVGRRPRCRGRPASVPGRDGRRTPDVLPGRGLPGHGVRRHAERSQAARSLMVQTLGSGVARLAALAYRSALMPPPARPGRLVLAGDMRPGSWRLGAFEVVLEPSRLVVRHPSSPHGVALRSAGAFAAALRGDVRFTGLAGHLGIDERVRARLPDQVLDGASYAAGTLRFVGRFAGSRESRDSPFTVEFKAVDDETLEVALSLVGPGARAAPDAI